MNYYNEFDPQAAAWLRQLIADGHLPAGDVDERSIEDVEPRELAGYTQCHFFAGIGGWPLALQLAGWPADRPIWTGSCPCQPFSAAGKGAGFDDERHLWPSFQWLIGQCRPAIVVGEQVASAAVGPWIDLVLSDLEALGYASGAYAGPAAGVGAPHLRDRSYWVGYADNTRSQGYAGNGGAARGQGSERSVTATGVSVRLADHDGLRLEPGAFAGLLDAEHHAEPCGGLIGLGNTDGERQDSQREIRQGSESELARGGQSGGRRPGPVNGPWRDADWLGCRDGKWRPVEPGTFPLAYGVPTRVGRLRGYGNAIVPQQAAEFIKALMAYSGLSL